jgi:hypothetical protein
MSASGRYNANAHAANARQLSGAEGSRMETIRVLEKTGKDGTLHLRIPLGKAETDYEVVVVVQPKPPGLTEALGWPPGYFDLAGSITDETFVRPPQGKLPRSVDLE